MDHLTGLLKELQSPARGQIVLRTLVLIFDDILNHPLEDKFRFIKRDELTGIGVKLLESCGFVDGPPGELVLPANANLAQMKEVREDIQQLIEKAERGALAPAAPPAAAPKIKEGPVANAPSVAAALQMAAASVSPSAAMVSLYSTDSNPNHGFDDTLGGMNPQVHGRQNPARGDPPRTSRQIPQSVAAAAAKVGQAVRMPGAGSGVASKANNNNIGSSTWMEAPGGVSPESRLVVDLPESEFTYIERPWSHFVTRWAAIDVQIERMVGEQPFTMVDLGSCSGFFSLQAAAGYPNALVIGIEGSVGIGNGTSGVTGNEDQIIATKAVQTHFSWIEKLQLQNCLVTPEVWDYQRVCTFAAFGRPISDILLSLSVIHHIDNVSTEQYQNAGLGHVEGTLHLMVKLLELAPRHFIELPDRPWMEHIYSAYGTARAFLEAAVAQSGRQWSFIGPLCVSEWWGWRELWLLEDMGPKLNAIPRQGLKALFPRILGIAHESGNLGAARSSNAGAAFEHLGDSQLQAQNFARISQSTHIPPALPSSAQPVPQQAPRQHEQIERQPFSAGQSQLTQETLGAALLAAPTALIAAHVQLRDAMGSGETMLQEARTVW